MHTVENEFHCRVVKSQEDFLKAMAVGATCFDDAARLPFERLFDGNDLCATHIIVLRNEEPVGTGRIRWFNGFAKLERTCIRPDFRPTSALRTLADFAHHHIAMKGFPKAITHAERKYAAVWRRQFGYKINEDKPAFKLAGHDAEYVELYKELPRLNAALTGDSNVLLLSRIEGEWEAPSPFE